MKLFSFFYFSKIKQNYNFNKGLMNLFTQTFNPIIGENTWEVQNENYDFHQEIARSGFGDMLHDTERNQKYYLALKRTIKRLHDAGDKAHVLDIGTGTGLLSMMAVKCGADSVVACEAFKPMADCAEKIIDSNGMKDKIKLIKKRSTEITVANNAELDFDMERKANVLVTEIFDTELIGEGAIQIFNHAHEYLLEPNSKIIPSSARIYVQVVESSLVNSWNKPNLFANLEGEVLLKTPKSIEMCSGEAAVHDLQLSQLNRTQFNIITNPIEIFDFDFSSTLQLLRTRNIKFIPKDSGIVQGIFFWWDLQMDDDKNDKIILSCAPYWAHPDYDEAHNNKNNIPWRDHWMQAIYYFPKSLFLSKGEEYYLTVNHDEYSFWFDVDKSIKDLKQIKRHSCTCSFHLAYPRTRIGQLNNSLRNKKYLQILEEQINSNSIVLCLSQGSLLALSMAAMGAKRVICLEPERLSYDVMSSYVKDNQLQNIKLIKKIDEIENLNEITHVFSEPYFTFAVLQFDNFYFGTIITQIKQKLNENVKIIPVKAKIVAVPVEFVDLHKIKVSLNECEGFNLEIFDKMLSKSSELADSKVEAQPLWEYPCKALGNAKDILTVDFMNFNEEIIKDGDMKLESNGICNGIAIWVDWDLTGQDHEKFIISTGPKIHSYIEVGKLIPWEMFTRQGVHLFEKPVCSNKKTSVEWNVKFKPSEGKLNFSFNFRTS